MVSPGGDRARAEGQPTQLASPVLATRAVSRGGGLTQELVLQRVRKREEGWLGEGSGAGGPGVRWG